MELTRIILPANSNTPSVDRQDHIATQIVNNGSPTTRIWKSKNTLILNYENGAQRYLDLIEISPQIGTPIVKNTIKLNSPAKSSNHFSGLNIVT